MLMESALVITLMMLIQCIFPFSLSHFSFLFLLLQQHALTNRAIYVFECVYVDVCTLLYDGG